jgi:S-adenosylmethionine:tRNA ribosyltransferase-isomerase
MDAPRKAGLVIVGPHEQGLWRLRAEGTSVESLLDQYGHVPLPPYLDRADQSADRDWYQTVFARRDGAVAAPTAGLHFTPELFARLERDGIMLARIVLHVGPGTFLPVRASRSEEHRVLSERYEVPPEAAAAMNRARESGGRIIAVGTTVVRALETAAQGQPSSGWTGLTILPGHRFRSVDALLTNFHLPRSSLLLLVSAFAGRERVLEAYAEARDSGFRFYSYGDAMLIQ